MLKSFKRIIILVSALIGVGSACFFIGKENLEGHIKNSRVFITGNIHGKLDIQKLNENNFREKRELSEYDNLIILGDFGLIWDNNIEDEMILDKLSKEKYKILFIDGTHENFDLLNKYELVDLYGGKAHKIRDNIYHLIRGEVYTIGKKDYLVFGGGESLDKELRIEGEDYWQEEYPSISDWENMNINLNKSNNYVDYILTHTPPSNDLKIIGETVGINLGEGNALNKDLQKVADNVKYKKWIHAYYHLDLDISKKHLSIFEKIIELK